MSTHDNPGDLAVYIHWPYCARICPYCDFNVYKQRRDDTLVEAILSDLTYWKTLGDHDTVTSIHFGGGTPSLLAPSDITRIINQVSTIWTLAQTCEIALEANPDNFETQTLQGFVDAGINRLSFGVQSFHDPALKFLGRTHTGAQATAALKSAVDICPSVSADLIFGWAGQTADLWDRDMKTALSTGVSHISAYQLTIEPGTAFSKAQSRGEIRAVSNDESADFYDMTTDRLTAAGFEAYEISNYAKPGHKSRHNLSYWLGQDYVGVGPGAHGRVTRGGQRRATETHLTPGAYVKAVSATGTGMATISTLTPTDWADEYVLMSLRSSDGMSLSRLSDILGCDPPTDNITAMVNAGFLKTHGDRVVATPQGRPVLNAVIAHILSP